MDIISYDAQSNLHWVTISCIYCYAWTQGKENKFVLTFTFPALLYQPPELEEQIKGRRYQQFPRNLIHDCNIQVQYEYSGHWHWWNKWQVNNPRKNTWIFNDGASWESVREVLLLKVYGNWKLLPYLIMSYISSSIEFKTYLESSYCVSLTSPVQCMQKVGLK